MGKYVNESSFEVTKETAKRISEVRHGKMKENGFHMEMPSLIGLKLTDRCNLRCKHCYEWSEHGYYSQRGNSGGCTEIGLDVIKKIISETRKNKAGLYLWGGEPLCYSHFETLAELIEKEERQCVICTNGMLIPDKLDLLLKIGRNLEVLIAMEGFEEENDAIRGSGVFPKIMEAIRVLLEARKDGVFHGKITIHTVINHNNFSKLYEYVQFVQGLGVDSLILCFPWYISDESEQLMECCIKEKFSWLVVPDGYRSWKSFKYGLPSEAADQIYEQLCMIHNNPWTFNVRYFPKVEREMLKDFIKGKATQMGSPARCNSISMRMDVMEDGTVTTCKHFKEFMVGDLNKSSVYEIWNSKEYNKIRQIMDEGLMPVCSQCNNFYLHSGKH